MATDAPTCSLDEAVADVATRVRERWEVCVVTNDRGVVLGLLVLSALPTNQQTTVENAMMPGPRTIRPSARLEAIAKRMRDQRLARIVVTRSDGTLLGVLRREDVGVDA